MAEHHLNHSVLASQPALTTPALCTALRDATHSIHQRLHEAPLFSRLLRGALSMDDYQTLLRHYAAFYAAIDAPLAMARQRLAAHREVAVAATNGWNPLALLQADLRACDQQDELPISVARLHFNAAQALGCLYVAEGSRLGARVLYRQLDKLFGTQRAGRSFLGASTSPAAWQMLCAELNTLPLQGAEIQDVIAGALQTFSLFEQLLQQNAETQREPVLEQLA